MTMVKVMVKGMTWSKRSCGISVDLYRRAEHN